MPTNGSEAAAALPKEISEALDEILSAASLEDFGHDASARASRRAYTKELRSDLELLIMAALTAAAEQGKVLWEGPAGIAPITGGSLMVNCDAKGEENIRDWIRLMCDGCARVARVRVTELSTEPTGAEK